MNQRAQTSFIVSILCLIVFFFLVLVLETEFMVQFDYFVLESVASIRADWITTVMEAFAFIGSVPVVIVLAIIMIVVLLILKTPQKEIFFTTATLATTGLLNTVVKQIVARVRPEDFMMVDLSSYSFPSGHTMGAMSFYAVLTFFIWKRVDSFQVRIGVLLFAVVMILGMGFSRIYLGVHYATDVFGGFLLSVAIIAFFYWFFRTRLTKD